VRSKRLPSPRVVAGVVPATTGAWDSKRPKFRFPLPACGREGRSPSHRYDVAADVDARGTEGAVRILGRGHDADGCTRLKLALVADFVADDRNIRPHDDFLLTVLVFHRDDRAVDAADGLAGGAIGHGADAGAVGGAVPVPTMAVTGAALRLGEDVHFDRLLGAVRLRHGTAADIGTFLDVGDGRLQHADHDRIVGELERDRRAVWSFDQQRIAVDLLDGAAHALRLRLLRQGGGNRNRRGKSCGGQYPHWVHLNPPKGVLARVENTPAGSQSEEAPAGPIRSGSTWTGLPGGAMPGPLANEWDSSSQLGK